MVGKGAKRFVRVYTPEKTVNYEVLIKELFAIKYPDFEPVETALEIELTARIMIPSSASKKRKKLMEDREIRPTKRPDIDNILKAVLDALEGLAYKNDAQIVAAKVNKFYSVRPHLDIKIYKF